MPDKPRILVIDDEIGDPRFSDQRKFLMDVGAADDDAHPYAFEFTSGYFNGEFSIDFVLDTVREGWKPDKNQVWALILLDVGFRRGEDIVQNDFGLQVLRAIRESPDLGRQVPVVMLTSVLDSRRSSAFGAADGFMPKTNDTGWTINRETLESNLWLHGLIPDTRPADALVGRSLAFLETLRLIRKETRKYPGGTIPQMCLLGERGTGKTALARFVHAISSRAGATFLPIQAERSDAAPYLGKLFGAWPGAYSDAGDGKVGAFESAHQGTLFLDDIHHLHLNAQARLLHARTANSQDCIRTIERYGAPPSKGSRDLQRAKPAIKGDFDIDTGMITVDVSLIAASNQALDVEEVLHKIGFQPDLWDKLKPVIHVPGLNQRRSDIRMLINHELCQGLGKPAGSPLNIEENVYECLEHADWHPRGNIRGLHEVARNLIQEYRAFGVVTITQLPKDLRKSEPQSKIPESESQSEKRLQPPFKTEPEKQPQPTGDHSVRLLAQYRANLEYLNSILREVEKKFGKVEPTGVVREMFGKHKEKITGTQSLDIIKSLFFDPILPNRSVAIILESDDFKQLTAWVEDQPLLKEMKAKCLIRSTNKNKSAK